MLDGHHRHHHPEQHFTKGEVVRDIIFGASDGLTVPFALMAGIVGAVASSRLVLVAGMAEIAAGSVSMGLGGYLASRQSSEIYFSERAREELEVLEKPEVEKSELREIFQHYGLSSTACEPLVEALSKNPKQWVDFMMRFELGLEKPEPQSALWSAATIAGSYVLGGLIPLAPYFFVNNPYRALELSSLFTMTALLVFGYVKGRLVANKRGLKSALQTLVIGSLAGGAAFVLARLIR